MTPEDREWLETLCRRPEPSSASVRAALTEIDSLTTRLEAVVAVAKALSDFSWSAVEPDCHASGEYLNSLLRNLRDVLDAEGKL